jgi:hypothetical protein
MTTKPAPRPAAPRPARIPKPRRVALQGVYVVESDRGTFVGRVDTRPDGSLVVRSGLRGHPAHLRRDEIEAVIPAAKHPDVEVAFSDC